MGFVLGFLPWILYWILVGNIDFRLAICIALAVAVAAQVISRLRRQPWRSLEVGSLVIFVLLAISSFLVSDALLQQWLQPLSNLGLFAVALIGILIGRPFVREYATGSVDAETAQGDGFRYLTSAMTWLWVVVFGLMTVISAIPPLVDGAASNQDEGSLLSVLCYWVLPYLLLGIAGLVSAVFPKWFDKQKSLIDRRESAETPSPMPPTAPPADVDDAVIGLRVPEDSSHEDPLTVQIEAAPAGAQVGLSLTGADLFGRRWRSEATYLGDGSGPVDLAATAPSSGDWAEADPTAPLWAMRFASPDLTPDLFVPPPDPWLVTVDVEVSGVGRAQRTIRRHAAAPGVRVESVSVNGLPARLAVPAGSPPTGGWPAVACFGGSEGGCDSQTGLALLLASHGYLGLAATWVPEDEAAKQIASVPLERFADAVDFLGAHDQVDPGRIGAIAVSRGSEGLLAALSRLPVTAPRGVVLVSPSSVTWQAMGSEGSIPDLPSWTAAGKPVPWRHVPTGELMPQLIRNAWQIGRDTAAHRPTLLRLHGAYAAGLRQPDTDAGIDAAAVRSRLLILTGSLDQVWPSERMALDILRRRASTDDQHQHYLGAGHLIRLGNLPTDAQWTGGVAFGGNRSDQAAAQRDATARVLAFFRSTLS